MSYQEVSQKFALARNASGLTQKEVADSAGVSVPTVRSLEKGTGNTKREELEAMLEAVGLQLDATDLN